MNKIRMYQVGAGAVFCCLLLLLYFLVLRIPVGDDQIINTTVAPEIETPDAPALPQFFFASKFPFISDLSTDAALQCLKIGPACPESFGNMSSWSRLWYEFNDDGSLNRTREDDLNDKSEPQDVVYDRLYLTRNKTHSISNVYQLTRDTNTLTCETYFIKYQFSRFYLSNSTFVGTEVFKGEYCNKWESHWESNDKMGNYLTWTSIDTKKLVGFESVGNILIWFVQIFELPSIDEEIFTQPINVTCSDAFHTRHTGDPYLLRTPIVTEGI